jgi:hypothetical protein
MDTREVFECIKKVCFKLESSGFTDEIPPFVSGVSQSISAQAAKRRDVFAEVESLGCCMVTLLSYVDTNEKARESACGLIQGLLEKLNASLHKAANMVDTDKYAILSGRGGASDLYVLPIRIAKILGWASIPVLISREQVGEKGEFQKIFVRLCNLCIEKYPLSMVSVSDAQAPYIFSSITALIRVQEIDMAERVLGLYYNSYIESRGRITLPSIAPEKIVEFILRKCWGNYRGAKDIYAKPDEFLSVMLFLSKSLRLEDEIDPHLRMIDHHVFNIFIPNSYTKFADETIRDGVNMSFHIGSEHGLGVFTVDDFFCHWRNLCEVKLVREMEEFEDLIGNLALVSSLVFPNRVAWKPLGRFIVEQINR